MGQELIRHLDQFLANRPYQAVFLYVHPEIRRLAAVTTFLKGQYSWPVVSIGYELSGLLRDVASENRPSHIPRLFADSLHRFAPGPVLCTEIDLLLEPVFKLNPLRLFLDAGKTTALIIPWPGTYQNGVLAYAVPEHGHYRTWPTNDLCDYCVVPVIDV